MEFSMICSGKLIHVFYIPPKENKRKWGCMCTREKIGVYVETVHLILCSFSKVINILQ